MSTSSMQLKLQIIDIVIIVLYFVVVLGLGLYLARRERGSTDFFLAGRRLTWPIIGASLFASNISSEHLVGLAADGFRSGLAVGNYEWGAGVALLILAVIFVPFYIASGITTLPEFLGKRYSEASRLYLSLINIVANVFIRISVALYAGALVIRELFGIGLWTSVFVLAGTTVLYTAAGGLTAVMYTDTIQAVVLLVGSTILTLVALNAAGGWSTLRAELDPSFFEMVRPLSDPEMPWTGLLLGVPILGIWYWCTDQVITQRVLAAADTRHARLGALFAGFLKITPVFVFVLPGVAGRILFPDAEAASIYPRMVAELLPAGLVGLIAVALIASLMSSIDSTLNSTSTLVAFDLYRKFRPNAGEALLTRIGRLTTVAVMIFGILWVQVVMNAGSLFQYLQAVSAAISPPITACFLLGVLWPRINAAGAIASLVTGFLLGVSLLIGAQVLELFTLPLLHAAVVNFIISSAVLVGVSLLSSPPSEDSIRALTWQHLHVASASRVAKFLCGLLALILAALWLTFA